jgi:hypothetical protein
LIYHWFREQIVVNFNIISNVLELKYIQEIINQISYIWTRFWATTLFGVYCIDPNTNEQVTSRKKTKEEIINLDAGIGKQKTTEQRWPQDALYLSATHTLSNINSRESRGCVGAGREEVPVGREAGLGEDASPAEDRACRCDAGGGGRREISKYKPILPPVW